MYIYDELEIAALYYTSSNRNSDYLQGDLVCCSPVGLGRLLRSGEIVFRQTVPIWRNGCLGQTVSIGEIDVLGSLF